MLDVLLQKENLERDVLEAFFLQALYWSLGAGLLEDGRAKFNTFIKNLAAMPLNDNPKKLSGPGEFSGHINDRQGCVYLCVLIVVWLNASQRIWCLIE